MPRLGALRHRSPPPGSGAAGCFPHPRRHIRLRSGWSRPQWRTAHSASLPASAPATSCRRRWGPAAGRCSCADLTSPSSVLEIDSFIVVVDRHGKRDLCLVLPDHIFVQNLFDLLRLWQGGSRNRPLLPCSALRKRRPSSAKHLLAQFDAFVADIHARDRRSACSYLRPGVLPQKEHLNIFSGHFFALPCQHRFDSYRLFNDLVDQAVLASPPPRS